MTKRKTLEQKIAARIARKRDTVLLRKDFEDLGGYDQVGRALGKLIAKGELMKIGYGLYAKTRPELINGKRWPQKPLPTLAREALNRLGVETAPSRAEQDYNAGRSTQVPTGRRIAVKGRVNRKIGVDGTYVSYEHAA